MEEGPDRHHQHVPQQVVKYVPQHVAQQPGPWLGATTTTNIGSVDSVDCLPLHSLPKEIANKKSQGSGAAIKTY